MNDFDLQTLCRDYQRLLRLEDWRIVVRFVSPGDLPEASQAHSEWSENSQDAAIKILAQEHFATGKFMNDYDAEQALVHEMLHIKFWAVDKENSSAFEFAIDSTADCVVKLKRQTEELWK